MEVFNKETGRLLDYLQTQTPAIVSFCFKILLSILAFYIGVKLISRVILLIKSSLNRAGIDKGVVQFACSLSKIMLYLVLIFSISTQFGVTESSVAALLGTAGVTIGLALQGGLQNLAGGVMILLFKPFQVGDYVVLDSQTGSEGTVSRIEMCYTTLISVDNKNIVIPNGTLSNSTLINVTASDERKLEILVGISYQSDLEKAKSILQEILETEEKIIKNEEMLVFVSELAESSVRIGFRAWVLTEDYWPLKWKLNEEIKLQFDAQGIEIAYPQLDVHVRSTKQI